MYNISLKEQNLYQIKWLVACILAGVFISQCLNSSTIEAQTPSNLAVLQQGPISVGPPVANVTVSKSYTILGTTIAQRISNESSESNLIFVYQDHLGSDIGYSSLESSDINNNMVRYLPFGNVSNQSKMEDILYLRFAGHANRNDSELIYMNQRYYLPSIRQFVSPDTLIPNYASPGYLNRYSYVLNNPLRFTDPTGHCPKPTDFSTSQRIICFAAFIPTDTSSGLGSMQMAADGRSFSENSPVDASRFWLWIDADTGENLTPSALANEEGIYVSSSVNLYRVSGRRCVRFCEVSPTSVNHLKISLARTDDTWEQGDPIVLDFSMLCSTILCHFGPGPDGRAVFVPNTTSGQFTTVLSTDGFPNLEAYLWENGQLTSVLFQVQNFSADELIGGEATWNSISNMFTPFTLLENGSQYHGIPIHTNTTSIPNCVRQNYCRT